VAITQSTILPLEYGEFTISYHAFEDEKCISIRHGDVTTGIPIVRIHSSCLFGEAFHALDCDCADQLTSTLKLIVENGKGVVMYQFAEGRGLGLEQKIQALELQRTKKIDTVAAFKLLGFEPDLRGYDIPLRALKELKLSRTIQFASQNPRKLSAIEEEGYVVEKIVHPQIRVTPHNEKELLTKKHKLGYKIETV